MKEISNQQKKRIWVITMFPELFRPFISCGIAGSAFQGERNIDLEVHLVKLSDFSKKGFKGVDDSPYGGGPGMVIRPDVLKSALMEGVVLPGEYGDNFQDKLKIIYPNPRGLVWNNKECKTFAKEYLNPEVDKDLVFICGRYEGIDQRFIDLYVDLEISVGDFILTGGELATICILDSAIRFIPGILGNRLSANSESFENGLLEGPQYTRPRNFEGRPVPDLLLSGHHKEIKNFQLDQGKQVTKILRPDLYNSYTESS